VTNTGRMLSSEPSLGDLNCRQKRKITAREGGHGRFGPGCGPGGSRAIEGKGGMAWGESMKDANTGQGLERIERRELGTTKREQGLSNEGRRSKK
jgi:hypothetical protein